MFQCGSMGDESGAPQLPKRVWSAICLDLVGPGGEGRAQWCCAHPDIVHLWGMGPGGRPHVCLVFEECSEIKDLPPAGSCRIFLESGASPRAVPGQGIFARRWVAARGTVVGLTRWPRWLVRGGRACLACGDRVPGLHRAAPPGAWRWLVSAEAQGLRKIRRGSPALRRPLGE